MFWNIVIAIASYALQLVLAPKPQNARPAALAEFDLPVAEEGLEFGVLSGTELIKRPNVTWYGDYRFEDIKGARRYGFFGPRQVIGHRYHLGMQMLLCHGPADALTEIWIGDKLAWEGECTGGQIVINQPDLFGGEEREGGIVGTIDVCMGGPTQGQNDYLQSVLGNDIPAYRGVVTVVLRQVYVGTNTYIKPWAFKLKRIHKKSDGSLQWYDEKAAVPDTPLQSVDPDPDTEYDGADVTHNDSTCAITGDYFVSIYYPTGSITCWQYPTFATPLWTIVDPDSAQSIAVDQNGHVFTSYQSDPMVKVWDITNGSLLATVNLSGVGATIGNTALSCITEGATTTVCLFGQRWVLISGAGGSWAQGLDFDGPDWLVATQAGVVGSTYVYAVKGGISVAFDNKVYRASRSGFSVATEVLLAEVEESITAIGYDAENERVVVIDFAGKIHIYSEDLSTHIVSSPGGEGWEPATSGVRHGISNAMFTDYGFAFVAAEAGAGADRVLVQYTKDGSLISVVNVTDAGYVNGGSSDIVNSAVDPRNNFVAVWGITTTAPTAWQLISPLDALDMNPSHMIREYLTDPIWGMGYPDSDIDDDAFQAAADTFWNETFGLTILWVQEEQVEEIVNIVQSHVDAVLYVSTTSGKFVLKAIRRDYDVNTIPVVTEDDVVEWDEVKRRQPPDAVTQVTVKYTDRRNPGNKTASVSWSNDAQAQQTGGTVNALRHYPGISRGALASRVATRDQRSLGAGLVSGSFTGKRTVAGFNPGDPIRLVSERRKLDGEVVRVGRIDRGNGRRNGVRIEFVQDVFNLGAEDLVDTSAGDWENPANPPAIVSPRLVWEMPYYELRQMIGPSETAALLSGDPGVGMLQAAGARPTPDTIDAAIYVDGVKRETMTFAPAGLLAADIGAVDIAIGLDEGSDLTLIEAGTLAAIVGSTPATTEIVRIGAVAGNELTVSSRGMLDTVPRDHAAGAALVVFDDFGMSDFIERTAGQTPDVKLVTRTPLGVLALALAPTDEVVLASRAMRPYRSADVKVNGVGSGTVDVVGVNPIPVTFARRNRLTETTPLAWNAADQTPEAGQTTTVTLTDLDLNVLHQYTGISGTSQNVDPGEFDGESSGYIIVSSERDGYESWTSYPLRVVVQTLDISGTPVTTAAEGDAYAGFTASATGGVPPYVFSLVGTWPAGIGIDPDTGEVSGTPTESGSFTGLSVRVTDDSSDTDDLPSFTLVVSPPGSASEAMTWNPADKATGITLLDSDREAYVASGSVEAVRATKGISSGKYVWCMHVDNAVNFRAGIATASLNVDSDSLGSGTTNVVINTGTGGVLYNGSTVTTLNTYTAGDYLMIAFDPAAGDIWFGKNGTWNGDPGAGTGAAKADVAAGTWYPVFGTASTGPAGKATLIPYPYTGPIGFTKLEPVALAGNKHWETIFQLNLTSSEGTWNGYNLREVLTAAQMLDKGSKSPTKVRVRLKGGTGENAQIDSSHIGLQAGAGDAYDFDGNQVALNISGSNAYTVSAGALTTSDEITMVVDGTTPLVLAWHFNNAAADVIAAVASAGHSAYYKLAANETGTADVSGYTNSAVSVRFVQEVQVLVDD